MSFFTCSCCRWYLSLGKSVLHLVVNCQISSSVWRTLEQALASTSNSRIMQLHGSLQDLRQGDESVTQFMQKAKASFDELVVASRPVLLKDFNLYVFRGLQREFKNFVTSLVTKAEPLSYADLYRHLLTHEFLHKTSLPSMGSAAINAPLLPTPNTPLKPLSLNASPLEILVLTGAVSMEDGVLTSSAIEGIGLLHSD